MRALLTVVALVAFAAGCAVAVDRSDDPAVAPASTARPEPTLTETATTPTAEPTVTPTETPEPTPTAEPTAAPTPVDTTPPVITGPDWSVTEADIERLASFVEEVHELAFTSRVIVVSDDDIGANYVNGYESFAEDDWRLLQALDLLEPELDRTAVNRARQDRIRGLCCREQGDELAIIVEPRATKLETEVIVVHELVHALHVQHPDLHGRPPRSSGFELPDPTHGVLEAIAQFVAFEYLNRQPAEMQDEIWPALTIVDDELARQTGAVPGAMLNFSYFTAPALAQAAYDADGADGLAALLERPPSTTEQIVYPDAWFDSEDRVSQDPPPLPDGARFLDEGRLGVAVLRWMLEPVADHTDLPQVLDLWTGDRWTLYRLADRVCISATIEMDTMPAAREVARMVGERYSTDATADSERRTDFDTCKVDA